MPLYPACHISTIPRGQEIGRNHRTAQHPWEASREGETYEVEAIVAKRWVKGVEEFYTKWVDYPDSENT